MQTNFYNKELVALVLIVFFSTVAPASVLATNTTSIITEASATSHSGGQNGADGADGAPGRDGEDGAPGSSVSSGGSSASSYIHTETVDGDTTVEIQKTTTGAGSSTASVMTNMASGSSSTENEVMDVPQVNDEERSALMGILTTLRIILLHYVEFLF